MNILAKLNELLSPILPVETGIFSGVPPDEYIVIIPMTDSFELFADNKPQADVSDVRLSLFSKKNYVKRKNEITALLLDAGLTITGRKYVGYEKDTGYHLYTIDAEDYFLQEE